MRRTPWLLMLLLAMAAPVQAKDKDKPLKIKTLKAIETLDPALEVLQVRYHNGMFKRLAARCPNLRDLDVEEHYDFPADDVLELKALKKLERLSIWGDLGIGEDVFKALGTLTQLKHINFGLG